MRRKHPALVASAVAAALITLQAQAAPLYWDTNAASPGAGSPANGTWDATSPNWNTDPAGADAGILAPYPADGSTSDVVFSAGNDATATNTVVVTGPFAANSLTFEEGTLRLNGVAPANPGDPLTSSLSIGPGGMTIVKGSDPLAAPATDANLALVIAADQTWTMNGLGSYTTFNGPVNVDHNLTLTRTTTSANANFLFKSNLGTGAGTVTVSGTTNSVTLQIGATGVYDDANHLLSGPVGTGTIVLSGGRLSSNSATSPNFNVGNPIEIASSAAIGGQSNTGPLTFTNSLTLDAAAAGQTLTLDSGKDATKNSQSLTFNGPVTLLGNAVISTNTNNSTTINGPISDDSATSGTPKSIDKWGAGVLTLAGNNSYAGHTTVHAGTLNFASTFLSPAPLTVVNGSTARLTTGSGATLRFSSLNLDSTSRLDLGDGLLVLDSADPATLAGYLQAGRNFGAWNAASGLTTSAPLDAFHAIGFISAADANVSSWGAATNLAGPETLLAITFYGDLNLDGQVNADDYALLDRGFASSLTGWSNGDLNYDGTIDQNDYLLIDTTYAQSHPLTPSFLSQREHQFGPTYVSTLLASVPEPSLLGCALFAIAATASRRRK